MRSGDGQNASVLEDDRTLDESLIIDEPEGAATGTRQKKSTSKKAGLMVLGVVLITGIIAAMFLFGFFGEKKVVKVEPPARTSGANPQSPDADQAITGLSQQMRSNAPVVQPLPDAAPLTYPQPGVTTLPQAPVTGTLPDVSNMPVTSTYPGMETAPTANVAGTVSTNAAPSTAAPSSTQPRTSTRRVVPLSEIDSKPAKQTSHYFFPEVGGKNNHPSEKTSPDEETAAPSNVPARSAPVVPPFGAQLPVRLLGAAYSLRRDGYVRLETTRAVKGDGWTLPRGTQLIGRQTSAQIDRLFISLVGYIADGKLVRVGGEVNGVDGGAGLQGSRKRIGNRFLKALREFGGAGLQAFNSWLGGRGGSTQIYMPTGTLGDLQNQYAQQSISEYVAVKAGTLGTVMITDLPEAINGTQPDVSGDGSGNVPGNLMSDDEVIELMTNGKPEEIRAALSRMPPQLRPLAQAALKEK